MIFSTTYCTLSSGEGDSFISNEKQAFFLYAVVFTAKSLVLVF